MISVQKKQHGFTLVELMISMMLGLLLIGAMLTMLSQARQSFRQDEMIAGMQDESRFAIREITRDISMAGFMADMISLGAVTLDASLDIDEDCQNSGGEAWAFRLAEAGGSDLALMALDNIVAADAVDVFSCLVADELVPGTDIISIKRVAGSSTASVDTGDAALRTNGTVASLFVEPIDSAVAAPAEDWFYTPMIYFIRSYSNVDGDGIPALCRKTLTAGTPPTVTTECIAQGVENLQLEYGIDSDGDGSVNAYVTSPDQDELESAISARVFLLVRTTDEDRAVDNDKTYSLSNAANFTPADNLHRRVYSTTVAIPNQRNRVVTGI